MNSQQKQKATTTPAEQAAPVELVPQPTAHKISDDTGELLDAIDELLDEMPQDLAQQFVQANGE